MTSELIRKVIEVAPSDFHTVAAICDAPDGARSLPYISPTDVDNGDARVVGGSYNLNNSNGNLPALLVYETSEGRGVLFCVWHRNDTIAEENAGNRMSVAERDKVKHLYNGVISSLKKSGLNWRPTAPPVYSYDNSYQAFSITMTFKWEPQTCVGGLVTPDVPHYTPGHY